MNKLLTTAAILAALAAPAFALNDNNAVGTSGVVNQGNLNNSAINNGNYGSGSFSPSASSSSTNVNTNVANGGSARQEQDQLQGQVQGQTASSGVSGSGNSSVTIKDRKQAPAVFAPGLVAGFDCMGSTSLGASLAGVGVGGGSTHSDEDCVGVYLYRVAKYEEKDDETAGNLLCDIPKYARNSAKCKGRAAKLGEPVAGIEREYEYPVNGSAADRRTR